MLEESDLWPVQKEAQELVTQSFAEKKFPFFRVGTRGGKTTFANYIAKKCFPFPIFIVGPAIQQIQDSYVEVFKDRDLRVEARTPNILLTELKRSALTQNAIDDRAKFFYRKYKESVFIFDDVEWYSQPKPEILNLIITLYNLKCNVMLFSSRGKEPLEFDKAICNTYNFASWDWNPLLGVEDVAGNFESDFHKAARDFGFYDSKNEEFKQALEQFKLEKNHAAN